MPTLLEHTSRTPRAVAWTRDDCRRMDEIGLLPERWELVRGEVINKMGQRVPHAQSVREFCDWLIRVYGKKHLLSQVTIDVSPADNPTSEPEPDVVVLNTPSSAITGNPRPEQIVLLVEVADTTLAYDLGSKASLYAQAGIPEYWVMDVRGRQLHQHRQPAGDRYASVTILDAGATLQAPGRAETVLVESLLG